MDRKKWKKIKKRYTATRITARLNMMPCQTWWLDEPRPVPTPPRPGRTRIWTTGRILSYSTRLNYERRPEVFLRPPIFLLSAAWAGWDARCLY